MSTEMPRFDLAESIRNAASMIAERPDQDTFITICSDSSLGNRTHGTLVFIPSSMSLDEVYAKRRAWTEARRQRQERWAADVLLGKELQ